MLDSALFTYCFVPAGQKPNMPLRHVCSFYEYDIYYSDKTECIVSKNNENAACAAVIGFCVDAFGMVAREDIVDTIAANVRSIEELLAFEQRLAGKYVLAVRLRDARTVILGDATGSIQINYLKRAPSTAASLEAFLFYEPGSDTRNPEYLGIRECSDISQAMPGDLTIYENVRALLPNHYLILNTAQQIRFQFAGTHQALSAQEAAEQTIPLIRCIAKETADKFPLVCPLTGGRDSRVVLAFLREQIPDIKCYTIKFDDTFSNRFDLQLAAQLAAQLHQPYVQIEDVELPADLTLEMQNLYGGRGFPLTLAMIAHTVAVHFGSCGIVNGDIIGQLGKGSLHRGIPSWLMNASYFRCKLHNYSQKAIKYLRIWQNDARKDTACETCDLFSWENRMGRWAAQENQLYDLLSVPYLNIFNCRAVISRWVRVPRKERKRSAIHSAIIARLLPEALNVPYEPEGRMEKLAKSNDLFYYIAGYLKYWVERNEFMREAEGKKHL